MPYSIFSSEMGYIPIGKTALAYLFREEGSVLLQRQDSRTSLQYFPRMGSILELKLKPAETNLDQNKQEPLPTSTEWGE